MIHAILTAVFSLQIAVAQSDTAYCPKIYSDAQCIIFSDTNEARAAEGLPPLKASLACTKLAQAHSKDMKSTGKLFHTSPKFGTFSKRVDAFKVPGTWHGENVFWSSQGTKYASNVVKGWLNSPGHKANILKTKARAVGIGVEAGYFTQCFSDEK